MSGSFKQPGDVVHWMGAVQAQDYAAAKWAIGLRMQNPKDATIEQAAANGSLLRTHILRPTWHFVSPEDIHWLLRLSSPRVHLGNASQYRRLEIDPGLIKISNSIIKKALQDGKQLTRMEISSALLQAGIDAKNLRLIYLLMAAELDGIICSGARRGKQFTYALLDERAPAGRAFTPDEALAELTCRYFTSHGPATEEDFRWWSGLTRSDVRKGISMNSYCLVSEEIDGKTYWYSDAGTICPSFTQNVLLMPNYDEYVIGYTDRSAIFHTDEPHKLDERDNPLFQNTILIDGQIRGTWKRTIKPDRVLIDTEFFIEPADDQINSMKQSIRGYSEFLGLPAELVHPI